MTPPTMDAHRKGWTWVAGQVVLFAALIAIPDGRAWPTTGAIGIVGNLAFFGGLAWIGIAALRLGTSLTPTPVPVKSGSLKTSGLYKFMRHPIYTGVLTVILGMTVPSGSILKLAVAALAFVFFDRKAAWEETQLARAYPDYERYAAHTAKFFPGIY